jgi:ABC-type nitrate/sulfonate/bicarbonate transport system permease component
LSAAVGAGLAPKRGLSLWGRRRAPLAARLLVIAALVLLWQIGARFADPLFVASPAAVVVAMPGLVSDPNVLGAIGLAFWELLIAFLIAGLGGGAIGLLIGRSRVALTLLFPVVLLLGSLPQAPLLPIFVLIFGIGPAAKIAFGVGHGIFPMIVTVAAGVRDVDPMLVRCARSMGARRRQIVWSIILPAAAPSFFTGLRLAMSGVLLGVLLAELFVSQAGVGFYTSRYTDGFQPANLFALIAMLAAIAVSMNEVCRLLENTFNKWRA